MIILHENLQIECPVKFFIIENIDICQKFNEHSVAQVTGIVKDSEKVLELHKFDFDTNIKIKAVFNDSEITLFEGVPINVFVKHIDDLFFVQLELMSYSIKLDIKKRSRSFQDENNQYADLFKNIIGEYDGQVFDTASGGAVQNRAIIQYEETDWEFLKRTTSHIGAVIFPDIKRNFLQIFIGVPQGNTYNDLSNNFIIKKDLKKYYDYQQNFGNWNDLDFVVYELEEMNQYELCDKVTYNEVRFAVVEKKIVLENGAMIFRYKLQQESAIKQNIFFNENFVGLSIDGKVIAIEDDKLKLHLSIDEEQSISKANWYKLNSPYTTEGSTGWYIMPEINESVKLYIPKKDENTAYVKAVNSDSGKQGSLRKNPPTKLLKTIDNKEMKLSPKEVQFTAVEGKISIALSKDSGISVTSSKEINIISEGDLLLNSDEMLIKANDNIVLSTPTSSIIIDEANHFKSVGGVNI